MGLFTRRKMAEKTKDESYKILSTTSLDENIEKIKMLLTDCEDVIYKEFRVGVEQNLKFTLIFTDGLVDKPFINDSILADLMYHAREIPPDAPELKDELFKLVRYGSIPSPELKEIRNIDDAVLAILTGDTVMLIDGTANIIVIGTKGWPARGISEPTTEAVIRGPKEGFTETYRFNSALVRRRIRDPRLKLKQMQIGRRSFTDIGIMYIEDIAQPELVAEVKRRLATIDIDAILDSGYIEEFIEDNPYSLFPQIKATERPDKVAAALYQGKVAILVDNTPFGLIVPATFNSFFHAAEDHYIRWIPATVLRMMRFIAGTLSLVTPALYIAVTSYHPGILPTGLVLSIAAAREGVPFPAVIEALILELTFELLREAGVRLPTLIGGVVGIVGGLVIGQAAVEAGIVSPIMVIIVAVTAISSFSIPDYSFSNAFRLFRFMLIFAAAFLGLYGMILGLLLMLGHLVRLKSFGTPYLSPFVSFTASDLKDTIVRLPMFMMKNRPMGIANDKVRMVNNRHEIKKGADIKEKRKGEDHNDKE
ncbi:MAG: GerA spore germination protein [Clostridia bacterium]|jgi:spore germination protein|nr:GerA spore germination protein [Clostridia bacterium]